MIKQQNPICAESKGETVAHVVSECGKLAQTEYKGRHDTVIVRRPDIAFIHKKEREVVIIDVAIQGDERVKDKELEKFEKYQLLKVSRMRKVIVLPVVIGALGAVLVNFKEYMKRIGVNVRLEVIQKTALLGTAKILRKVLSL